MQEASVAADARAALERHAWSEAFDLLSRADGEGQLSPEELELLAQASFWVGRLPAAIDARERAYALAVKAGRPGLAVTAAVNLGRDNLFRNATAVATAWLDRAERLLGDAEEGLGHGWLAVARSFHAALTGDTERSLAEASRGLEIARRIGDRDLEAMGLSEKGAALVSIGRVAEGLALVDEATIAAVGGELEPATAGGVCCTTIEACTSLGEWGRAAEWTEAQDRWFSREGIGGYPGMCRVFRSEIKRMRGAWLEAEAEARQASIELEGYIPAAVGSAMYQIGEIRLRRGDLPAAREALLRAHGLGTDPEPALSLLLLAGGKTSDAHAAIGRALAGPMRLPSWRAPPNSALHRLPLLAARAEIAVAAGDNAAARSAADELRAIAERFSTATVQATAAVALGAVALAEGDRATATHELRRAIELWAQVEAPYEGGRARATLADAFMADGATEAAAAELEAARSAFEHVGAVPDRRHAEAALAVLREPTASPGPTGAGRMVRTFVFTDVVDSTRLAEVLGDEAWQELLGWHDRMLRAVVDGLGGEEVKATGDGFFLAFADPDRAIEAAILIQRQLAEHRHATGFALGLRIGIHTAEANRAGLDYIGLGVNEAARIGGAAAGAEILVSEAALAAARRRWPASDPRRLELKGISRPLEVAAIDWH